MMTGRRKKRSRSSFNESEPIPIDLVIEILLRLPERSIARFRSVSKLWGSTFRTPYFTESFLKISSSRTKLLFTCLKDGETFFFSSSHPKNPSPPIAANVHMSFPINCPTDICRPVRGLVCGLNQRTSKERTDTMPLICNPSTGEYLALPIVKTRKKRVISCFGYDPIDKQFKVLCMTISDSGLLSEEHQLLTLGEAKEEPSWKMIECDVPHRPAVIELINGFFRNDEICIDGVVYYFAVIVNDVYDSYHGIICFDIRSEKFNYIKKAGHQGYTTIEKLESTLVNYKGKLAKLEPNIANNGICDCIQLWVLGDAKKHEWSSYFYVLPPSWKNIYKETKLCFVGATSTGEIVLSPNTISDSFYLIYYNPERNTITKVGIQGLEAYKSCKAYTYLDHVEDVTLFSSV